MLNERKAFDTDTFLLGVCYYPEHWEESLWNEDFRRMAELGFNVVRMGETAWNVMEPEEGQYDFGLFDRAIEAAVRHGLQIIMGTPTYAPPAWLTEKYPEVLRVDFHGQTMAHGSRRHYNYTSTTYWRLCNGIVSELINHYKTHPAIIGWQVDNELNCHSDTSYADSDHLAFREWCMEKYGTLERLNEAWGAAFWAQTYTAWSQVFLPKPTVTYHSPSLLLDFYRFTSNTAIVFAQMQYERLKAEAPHQFVTHNGIFGNIDYKTFTERTVDFLSYDSYPSFQLMRSDVPVREKDKLSSKHLSRMRGYSEKFMILEQQAGPGGQTGNGLNNDRDDYLQVSPKPGQVRLWTWQSIAHGADGVLYFRWRTCPYGAETLWHGINDYGNQPNRRLREVRVVAEETRRMSALLVGTKVTATVAILIDYDNDSNCKIDRHTGGEYWRSEENIYLALSERHVGTDVLDLSELADETALNRYTIVFLPNGQILSETDTTLLTKYVEQGGTLVLGPRSGYKDRNNQAYRLPFPGVVRSLAGIAVEEFTMVGKGEQSDVGGAAQALQSTIHFSAEDTFVQAPLFHEILRVEAEGVRMAATHSSDYYAGEGAVSVRQVGKGRVVYFGTFFTLDNTVALLNDLNVNDPALGWAKLPHEIEAIYRTDGTNQYTVLLNYADRPVTVNFRQIVHDHISNVDLSGEHVLEPYAVRFLEL
jgi:beta-galactosidase